MHPFAGVIMQDEFDIIERYFSGLPQSDLVRLGPGDDCAVLSPPPGSDIVVSTDTLAAGVHFPGDASAKVMVQRAMGANLSDIAAMGATPMAILSALTLPDDNEQFLQDTSDTFRRECGRWHVPLVGGNLCRGTLSITLTVLGLVPAGTALRRDGAVPGDDVYVSGTLGDAAGGLRCLLHDNEVAGEAESVLIERYEHPEPRLAAGQQLRAFTSAAIDISDGFAADLGHLCRASGVGAVVELDDLPVSGALRRLFPRELDDLSLRGGDDYELCFTAAAEHRAAIEDLGRSLDLGLTRVGMVREDAGLLFLRDGEPADVDVSGYRHFQGDLNEE